MRVLNVGCGRNKLGFPEAAQAIEVVGVDVSPESQADVIHDLNHFPYPFEDDQFDLIVMLDVIEHLDDVAATINELYRISKHGADLCIRTPHYSSYWAYGDPTHKHFFSSFAFDGFLVGNVNVVYAKASYELIERTLEFPKVWRITGVAWLANRFTHRWEQLFAFTFRALSMVFRLRTVKRQRLDAAGNGPALP